MDSGCIFSIFRMGFFSVMAGAALSIVSLFAVSRTSVDSNQPIEVALPHDAELMGIESFGRMKRLYYETPQSPEDAAVFYNDYMREFYGDSAPEQQCIRTPPDGIMPGYVEGNGTVPYEYRCMFAHRDINLNRFTEVLIQPGVRNDRMGFDYTGKTRIEVEQRW